ncbi:MAG: hypothetical protein RBU25_20525, partial [Lentisphaeria bacterium]|nr:hypothetical protein [Lentisphaeria bacterium]
VDLLRRLTAELLAEAGGNALDSKASREILRRFSAQEPDCPTGAAGGKLRQDAEAIAAAERIVADLVEAKFPPLDVDKLKTEAQARYPIYQKGELIEFLYAINPQNVRKVRGLYGGRNARSVLVGASAIQIEDIARVQGNDEVVLRFDPDASEALRREYVAQKLAEYRAAREAYQTQAAAYTRAKELERVRQANQTDGYIFADGHWTTARELVTSLIGEEKERIRQEAQAAIERALAVKQERIAAAANLQAVREGELANIVYANVDTAYAAYREQAESTPEPVAAPTPEPIPEPVAEPELVESTPAPSPTPVVEPPQEARLIPLWAYAVIGGLVLVGIVIGIVVWRREAAGPSSDQKQFFQGRGKVQRPIWQMAEEKPDTFKYVAYRYNTAEEARQALLQLSYVSERVGGDLVCRHDIYFGFGPHQEKFVTFVGGEKLNYALWREASAVLPEFPGAEYFRVSTAPDVNVEIPNLDSLLADSNLQIEHVENREGEGTDYSHYYIYRTSTKENAMEFLKHASIQEAGVHVVVLTQEGVFGKDENGIYEEAMDIWAERYPEFFGR